ncbi:LysR family transcriptional regulator [Magnetospira sp. QH-2]|uniref:LysR family transcriptional regulator n=1 Tax=Magnetospira sp. (strain QH-2) TaxID=1288970 RepID=UPI000A8A4E85|nr:LysR family transcriptional regulator [Magnetospira sp. QH-2]
MIDLNEMVIFARVVEAGSITGAAKMLGVPKSTVSRRLAELESRIGVRLLQRTTRSMTLTELGAAYYEHCAHIATEAEEADRLASLDQAEPRGWLRVSAPVEMGLADLGRLIGEFMAMYPQIRVQLDTSNRFVDLVQEGFDLAIRAGDLADSSLIARRLGSDRPVVCASPEYLALHGTPTHPRDLETHAAVMFGGIGDRKSFHFTKDDDPVTVVQTARLSANLIAVARDAAIVGSGIAILPGGVCRSALESGELVAVLTDWSLPETGIHAVYPSPRHLTTKVRTFIDFLAERFPQ